MWVLILLLRLVCRFGWFDLCFGWLGCCLDVAWLVLSLFEFDGFGLNGLLIWF